MKKSDAELVVLPFSALNITPRKKNHPLQKATRTNAFNNHILLVFLHLIPEFLRRNGDVQKVMQAETGKQERHHWSSFSKELLWVIQHKLL